MIGNAERREAEDRAALIVESAETDILKAAKNAVLNVERQDEYKKAVDAIIAKALKELPDNIPVREALRNYATKVYTEQLQILRINAHYYAMFSVLVASGERGADKYLSGVIANAGQDALQSKGFKIMAQNDDGSPYEHGVPAREMYRYYYRTVKRRTQYLVEIDAKADYDSPVSLRNIAEMQVRYEHQTRMIDSFRKEGADLVWIQPHANCSRRCEKYQGRLYSLSGRDGTIDGIPFKPLEYATNNPVDRYTTKAGRTYQNGCITGFNCRHRLVPYEKGNKPKQIPPTVVMKVRAAEENQREMERGIRRYRRIYAILGNSPEGLAARREAIARNKQYIDFSKANGLAFYPERTRIYSDI